MKKIFVIFILLTLIVVTGTQAQRWKKVRYEFVYGIGASNFLGDLGGGNGPSKHNFTEMDLGATRPAIFTGMRYRLSHRFAAKVNFIFSGIKGSDTYSTSNRTARNLSFKSLLFEGSSQVEFSILPEKTGRRYSFTSTKKIRLDGINTYIFAGIGGVYFNPKGLYIDNKWYALQPLGTEGQGLTGAKAKYSRVALCFPLGFGIKYSYNRRTNMGIEFGYRMTTTDYMDDVSDSYYDNNAIKEAYGEKAAYFADPREGTKVGGGQKWRGNPKYNDGYMFILFNLSFKLRVGRNGLPKF